MAKKKSKSSVQFILDYIRFQQTYAEVMGIKIVSDTLGNILDKISDKSIELYILEMEEQKQLGKQEMLLEIEQEMSIDKQV